MNRLSLFVAATLFCAALGRAEDAKAPPAAADPSGAIPEVMPAKTPAPKAEAAKPEAPKAEAPKAEAPKTEAPKSETPKAEPAKAEAPKAEAKPAAPAKVLSPEEALEGEWKFLENASPDASADPAAAIDDLAAFVDRNAGKPMTSDALMLLANLKEKKGDWKGALLDYLRLFYEYAGSKTAGRAKDAFMSLAERKLPKKFKADIAGLAAAPAGDDAAKRLASLIEKLPITIGEAVYEPAVDEVRRFEARFPNYAEGDAVQWSLGLLHEKGGKPGAALLAYRKLLAVFPGSPRRSKTQFGIAGLYAEGFKDYRKAADSYLELAAQFPDAPEVLPSLERTAALYVDKLRQYELAVEIDEKIIKLFPKTDAALRAFKEEAKLQRERFAKPLEAIKTYKRLTEQFGAPMAVEALQNAANIARRDLKDFASEIELRARLVKDYQNAKEAPAELLLIAEVYEDDVKDLDKAIAAYKDVSAKYAASKEAKKASERVLKLEKKKAQ